MHELYHRAAMNCSCGAMLYEGDDGIFCMATHLRLPWKEERHSKLCVRDDDGWVCVKQCSVHRAQLKLLETK